MAKDIVPSIRGVRGKFKGVSRRLINNVLSDLYNAGFLKNFRNGYAFV
ncbi:hypothetical protein Q8W15_16640 [Photobacterium damselae subsp. piscicida]|nr:hypothetical protein [Photobacterium damselae]MDP2534218.1 hypothetical protein [Photobacterium damselae subsp. piscicida]MDP2558468.1 hypothetical protein [Photobacterium damselae subsp. piscicida]MDP2570315.1 hypothetical protein [Photobacterium damselae subsp. piscicida]